MPRARKIGEHQQHRHDAPQVASTTPVSSSRGVPPPRARSAPRPPPPRAPATAAARRRPRPAGDPWRAAPRRLAQHPERGLRAPSSTPTAPGGSRRRTPPHPRQAHRDQRCGGITAAGEPRHPTAHPDAGAADQQRGQEHDGGQHHEQRDRRPDPPSMPCAPVAWEAAKAASLVKILENAIPGAVRCVWQTLNTLHERFHRLGWVRTTSASC